MERRPGFLALTTWLIVIITIAQPHLTQSRLSERVWLSDNSRQADPADLATYDVDAYNLSTCGQANLNQWQKEQRAFRCAASNPQTTGQSRIVDGIQAHEGGYPFHVKIMTSNSTANYFCGGTLIHNDLVITLSKCFLHDKFKASVLFGSNNHDNMTEIAASKWCYYDVTGILEGLDLAIIELKQPVRYEQNKIWPVCLMRGWEKPRQPTICSAMGMGAINDKNKTSSYLMTLPVRRRCFEFPADIPQYKYSHCYVSDDFGTVCSGDPGSPVVCYDRCGSGDRTRAFAVGTISGWRRGHRCQPGQEVRPIIVSEYHDVVFDLIRQVRKISGGTEPPHMTCRSAEKQMLR